MLNHLKIYLKKKKLVRDINSRIKSLALYLEHKIIQLRFEDYLNFWSEDKCTQIAAELLKKRLDGLALHNRANSLNIFFVGTYYDHEAQGFIQGLQKLGNVHIYTNLNGGYGINRSANTVLSQEEEGRWRDHLFESIVEANNIKAIDFVIGTFTAPSVALSTLLAIREVGIPIVNIAMDDMLPQHWRVKSKVRMGAFGLAPAVDLTLQTTPACIQRYLKSGYPAIYFPFASDPNIFCPAQVKDIDVLFIGNCYGKREKLIAKCIREGINIVAYGIGFENGHIAGEEVPKLFGRSKIILGSGLVGHSSSFCTLKLRDFDGPMAGGLYLTSHNPILENHFILGQEIVTYKNLDDCVYKIKFFLDNERERSRIAAAGRSRACAEHTWDIRLGILTRALNLS